MFRKILIANRGEIAVRIIRACREMGILTVAIYSEADHDALHVQLADEAVCIGPAPARDSYLNIVNILSATVLTHAEAIHPGYGLLSENTKFARMCGQCNIAFIGPSPDAMQAMGNKLNARMTMIKHNVPVIPGSQGIVEDLKQAYDDAKKAGYPVLVKAAAGGGGKGIRRVECEEELENAVEQAKAEALAAFGDDTVYIEKLLGSAHHIEFQIVCDSQGNAIHLFERDCSMQMNRQKLVEECPSTLLDHKLRKEMGAAALRAAKAVDYVGVGTVEFLVDDDLNYYFIEMNTRIQVEHPVTEMVTGVDIVKEQIQISAGLPLSRKQNEVILNGHAIECRINACDPNNGFYPSCGKSRMVLIPGGFGIRVDSMLYDECEILPYYDSMIAKVIASAPTREEAIIRMKRALDEFIVTGVELNTDFQFDLISTSEFETGNFYTDTVERILARGRNSL